jgi:hypothetical protein
LIILAELVRRLEAISKGAAIVSMLAIVALQLLLHPDAMLMLTAAGVVAFLLGWIGARAARDEVHAAWLFVAPLAPGLLMLVSGRDSPQLPDVVWMAGLAGFVIRSISWSRWTLPPLWSVLLGGWAMTLAFSWPVLVLREIALDPRMLRDTGVINSWAGLSAPHVVAWTLYVVAAQLLALLWFELIYGECTAASGRVPRAAHGLWAGVTVASVVAVIQGTIDVTFVNTPYWADLRRAAGTMLDPNAYGVAAACAGPIGFLAVRIWRPQAVAAGAIILGINWAGMWMSGSRTAVLICGIAGAVGLAIGSWRSRARVSSRSVLLGMSVAAAAVIAFAFAGGAVGPLKRLVDIPPGREGLVFLINRDQYGPIASEIIREHPLTGVGIGAYHYLAPDYERLERDRQLPFDNAQNWWRHQMTELGILGGTPVLLWSALVGWQVLTARPRNDRVLHTWVVRALLAGLGITSLFGMPTQNPVVLLWFFVLTAWMAALTSTDGPAPGARLERAGWIAAVVLAAAYAAGHVALASGRLSVVERAMRFQRPYMTGVYAPEPLENGHQFRWTAGESRFVVPVRSRGLTLRLWAQHPDIEQRPVRVLISTPCRVFFDRELTSGEPVLLRITLPPSADTFDARVAVSRTWSPAESGGSDTRQLGVAVQMDFDEGGVGRVPTDDRLQWPDCSAGLL